MDLFIDDATPSHVLFPPGRSTGLDLTGRPEGFAYAGTADPFPDELLIPRSEWQERIKERETLKITNRDHAKRVGLPCKDQASTNYCWINAPVYAVEMQRAIEGQPTVILSPASAGAQIKSYRNVGGWGKEGLEWIAKNGVAPVSLWPANAIDRRYATEAARTAALKYRVHEWWELQPRNIDHLVSCTLRGSCVAVGYPWWGHEVTIVDALWLDNTIALLFRNSWGSAWGDDGYGILQGSRMLPDDAVSPRLMAA